MAYPTDLTPLATPAPGAGEIAAQWPAPDLEELEFLKRQIGRTRTQMETTINAIGERLSPEYLIEQAKSSAREATVGRIKDMTDEANRRVEGMSNSLGQTIRENPLPAALIGLGVGWLWMAGRNRSTGYRGYRDGRYAGRPEQYEYFERDERGRLDGVREWVAEAADSTKQTASAISSQAEETVQNLGNRAGNAAQRAGDSVADTVSRTGEVIGGATEAIQERVTETAERTRQEAERLRWKAQWRGQMAVNGGKRSFWEAMEANPLVVGAVVAAAGAALGAAVPATEYENQILGETRERLFGEVRTRAQDAVERVQAVVDDTQRAAVAEVKESAHRNSLTVEDVMAGEDEPFTS
jgi:hypothetical protein